MKLVVVGGAKEGEEYRLDLPVTLGRAKEASIPLPHPLVSRQHCEIIERDDALFVRDLGSTNGTFVGRDRVKESFLHHGQLLTIGTVTFRASYATHTETCPQSDPKIPLPPDSDIDTASLTRVDTGQIAGTAKPRPKGPISGRRVRL